GERASAWAFNQSSGARPMALNSHRSTFHRGYEPSGDEKEEIMALAALIEFLDRHDVPYTVITHSPAYTAQGIAGLTHISGKELAKTVVVKLDGKLAMAVLPANFHVDLAALRRVLKAKTAMLAAEEEFEDRFAECETGA